MTQNIEDKFLGDRQVKAVKDAGATSRGGALVRVFFNDGTMSEVWTEKMLASDGVVTPQATDATQLRTTRLYPVVKEILGIALDYNLRIDEFSHLMQLVATSMNHNLDHAEQVKWQTKELNARTMNDVDQVILSAPVTLNDVLGPTA